MSAAKTWAGENIHSSAPTSAASCRRMASQAEVLRIGFARTSGCPRKPFDGGSRVNTFPQQITGWPSQERFSNCATDDNLNQGLRLLHDSLARWRHASSHSPASLRAGIVEDVESQEWLSHYRAALKTISNELPYASLLRWRSVKLSVVPIEPVLYSKDLEAGVDRTSPGLPLGAVVAKSRHILIEGGPGL
jgi:hypothetical protein